MDATAQDQTGLGPGTYKFVVTDSNDCKVEKNYIITEPAALAITEAISSHTGFNITCNGAMMDQLIYWSLEEHQYMLIGQQLMAQA